MTHGRLIDADALEQDGWCMSRIVQINEKTMEYQTRKPTDFPTIEPKKGKWLPHSEKSREYIGTVLVNVEYDYWFCDICGYRVEKGQPMYNFCPNCGADMRGEDES